MSDRSFVLYVGLGLLVTSTAFIVHARREGRCQAACWTAHLTYVSTDATACLCSDRGVPVAVAVPEAPHGR